MEPMLGRKSATSSARIGILKFMVLGYNSEYLYPAEISLKRRDLTHAQYVHSHSIRAVPDSLR